MTAKKIFLNTLPRLTALVLALLASLALPNRAVAQQVECANHSATQFKAVATTATRISTVDFSASGGQLDPAPLLETEIKTGATCVVVHSSAQADPQDNFVVFQASIDDIPMEGHIQFPYLSTAPATPVVFDPEETSLNASRMVAYTFFLKVRPGVHIVRIRFAGCCSANPGGGSGVARPAHRSATPARFRALCLTQTRSTTPRPERLQCSELRHVQQAWRPVVTAQVKLDGRTPPRRISR